MKLSSAIAAALTLSISFADDATSTPLYKNPKASVDDRVADLLSRMTIQEKTAQLIQGDISNWINTTDNSYNASGLVWNMETRAGQFYVGYPVPQQWIADGVKTAQDYLMHNTTLGIPALVQSEGIHGFLIGNATIFNSPIGFACSWNPALIQKMGAAIAQEASALGVNQIFAPLGDLARELRYGRVEETFGEDGYLAGEIGYAYIVGKFCPRFYPNFHSIFHPKFCPIFCPSFCRMFCRMFCPVLCPIFCLMFCLKLCLPLVIRSEANIREGLQGGNVSATVKHFAAYATPEQGLNAGPVHGGERELRTTYLPSYKRQIIDGGAYSIMSSYSAYDGVPLIANHHILTDILRTEWGYKYWVTSDAGATDRICNGFKMCQSTPLDKEAIVLYVCVVYIYLPNANIHRLYQLEMTSRWVEDPTTSKQFLLLYNLGGCLRILLIRLSLDFSAPSLQWACSRIHTWVYRQVKQHRRSTHQRRLPWLEKLMESPLFCSRIITISYL
jgi:hypothetical protein